MVHPILTIPENDTKLRQKSDEVTAFNQALSKLVDDLTDTLIAQTAPVGLGLSAPQIGVLKRVFVARVRNKIKHFVNPNILKFSPKEITFLEGCFSVPLLYGHVIRPAEIDLEAYDKQGKRSQNHYRGLVARIIQHEIDHLNGILFIDHVHDQNGKVFMVEKGKKGKEQLVELTYASTIPPSHQPTNPTVVFFGNTKYSAIVAKALHDRFGLTGVVTIPDKPVGRQRILTRSPVKKFAKENNIPVFETDKLDERAVDEIAKTNPDFLVVADYGLILPNQVLELPKYAAINVHHSLLPKYRGPSPAPTAILNGEKTSGVTIIKMTWDVDAGDILAQKEYELKPDETTDSLLTELNKLGGQLVIEVIENYLTHLRGESSSHLGGEQKQDESKTTYTHRFSKSDGQIDLADPPDPQTFDRMVRAFYPWPGVWSKWKVESGKWKILKFLPGNLIQPEGKRPMTIKEFQNGYPEAAKQLSILISFNFKTRT